jgi:hypothetical protein
LVEKWKHKREAEEHFAGKGTSILNFDTVFWGMEGFWKCTTSMDSAVGYSKIGLRSSKEGEKSHLKGTICGDGGGNERRQKRRGMGTSGIAGTVRCVVYA